ncbi:MAG TPA: hypothetical protein VHS76_11400 [Steroidobacteraceae bacterium]|jgi:hypothetical protein|nr:hypothetical protein [Steroidobacteraceae bacterium]
MPAQSPQIQTSVSHFRKSKLVSVLPMLLFAANALGGDDLDLKVTNDGIEDLFVTVYDMNTNPYSIVLEHARINGFVTVPISATADMRGRAKLSWSAISVDAGDRKCAHGTRRDLGIHASINVHVDSECN